nr:hypothetical protein REQ54_00620 [Rhizobium sp. Q54]
MNRPPIAQADIMQHIFGQLADIKPADALSAEGNVLP